MKMMKNASLMPNLKKPNKERAERMQSWRVTSLKPLGTGGFGKVFAGEALMASGNVKTVALKTMSISTLISCSHPCLLNSDGW